MTPLPQFIFFNSRDELLRIEVDKIVYFEGDGNYTKIMMKNKLKSSVGLNLSKMEESLSEQLKERASNFMRIGKRFIINRDFIYSINMQKMALVLSDFEHFAFQIPVSKEALKKIKELTIDTRR